MRLTLRTLLAYLDDTLDPTEIREIGQKVSESDAAQELVARIKQVSRRRRLTTPPATGPGAFDPNVVAEYLDSTLGPEQVAEVERTCLESDVHLAEIAACHQILTLILGEPALVPPTARERMYGLVRGREAIHSRRAAARTRPTAPSRPTEEEEGLLPGLPLGGRQAAWVRWVLPLAAAVLLFALCVIIWQAITPSSPQRPLAQNTLPSSPREPVVAATDKTAPDTSRVVDSSRAVEIPPRSTEVVVPPRTTEKSPRPEKPPEPAKGADLGQVTLVRDFPNLLLRHRSDSEAWQRLLPDKGEVTAGDALMALPGCRSQVEFKNGVNLLLWGNLPEFLDIPLLESAVTVESSNQDADLELTHQRGRILLSNQKPNARVRIHFDKERNKPAETWEVMFEDPGTEVSLDLFARYTPDIPFQLKEGGEGPRVEAYLVVLHGQASVKVDTRTFAVRARPNGPTVISWDNKGGPAQPGPLEPAMEPFWKKAIPQTPNAEAMDRALKELVARPANKPIETILQESLARDRPTAGRVLAIYCLGAVDALSQLIDVLSDEEEPSGDLRSAAVQTMRQWIGRDADNDRKLYDLLTTRKGYTPKQAELFMQLLHDLPRDQLMQPSTWEALIGYLKNDKPAIRELSYWHLFRLVPEGRGPKFNPAGDSKQRDTAYDAWKKLIPENQLPPILRNRPDAGGTAPPK